MAETQSSNNRIVAIFAILLMALLASLVAWRMGFFGGHEHHGHHVEIDVNHR